MKKILTPLVRSPLACFLFYVVVILLFTFFYCMLPNHFYHGNIIREKEYGLLEQEVVGELGGLLQEKLTIESANGYVMIGKEREYGLEYGGLSVDGYDEDEEYFELTVPIVDCQSYDNQETDAYMEYSISYRIKFVGTKVTNGYGVVMQTIRLEQTNAVYNAMTANESDELIDISPCFGGGNWNFSLTITEEFEQKLNKLMDAKYGYATYVENNFARMLYLSVVTITSLGFGDIVPITDTARLAIGVEAFLGVMIAGLFVNAIIHQTMNER